MRILIVANHVLSNDLGSGGDILFTELARRWQEQGHNVHILTSAAGKNSCAKVAGTTNVTSLPSSWVDNPQRYLDRPLLVGLVYLLRSVRALSLIRNIDTEVVYTPGDFWCDTLPTTIKKLQHNKVTWAAAIFHINEAPYKRRGNSLPASILSWLAQRVSFSLIRRTADVIFPLNSGVREALIERKWPPHKLHVQGAGLDAGKFNKIPSQSKRFTACYIGRINPTKGVFDLPRIWARVAKQAPDSTLLIMGKGSPTWESKLRRLIADEGIEDTVQYLGFVPSDKAYTLLKQSRLFISASTEEGFGMSIAEALACGLPAVGYDLPAYREFFPEGMTRVPVGNIQAFADAIVKYIHDRQLYQEHSERARAIANQYDWDSVAAAELNIITHVHS